MSGDQTGWKDANTLGTFELLERARALAEHAREKQPNSAGSVENQMHGGREKGDKGDKPSGIGQAATLQASLAVVVPRDDPEVIWRIDAMRRQVPINSPVPFLVARDHPALPGTCLSCGGPRAEGHSYRCDPCTRAAIAVVTRAHTNHQPAKLARRRRKEVSPSAQRLAALRHRGVV